MARVTIILEDDAMGEDRDAVRPANMQVKMELTEDEMGTRPSIAVITAHHFRHLWVDSGIPLVETADRVNAEISATKGEKATQMDAAAMVST